MVNKQSLPLLFFALLSLVVAFAAQSHIDTGRGTRQPELPSWNSFETMHYGNVGASAYTGTVNYSIPIYRYKDNDFDIPMSLDYATNGHRVNHNSSPCGLGWSLSNPGLITREVKGIPDETSKQVSNPSFEGYSVSNFTIYGYSHLSPNETYNDYLALSAIECSRYPCKERNGTLYEATPDIYRFNFCGFKGTFSRTPYNETMNGQIFRVYEACGSSRGMLVDADNDGTGFTLTDINGYKYHFSSHEVKAVFVNEGNYQKLVMSWIITWIKAPNGRTIRFIYDDCDVNGVTGFITGTSDYLYHPVINHLGIYYGQGSYSSSNNSIDENHIGKKRLRKILFPDSLELSCDYDVYPREWKDGIHSKEVSCGDSLMLKSISISRGQRILKNCLLSYSTNITEANASSGNCVKFLKTVSLSGEGKYYFDYNGENGYFPYLGTTHYDHWGYYNGEGGGFQLDFNNALFTYDAHYNESMVGNMKDAVPACGIIGTLSRITYPTGGHSELTYEPHTFSRAVVRADSTVVGNLSFQPRIIGIGSDKTAGGVRIKRIVTVAGDGTPTDTATYGYTLPEGTSSGILIGTPRYGIRYSINNQYVLSCYDLSNQIWDSGHTHIEYSDVTLSHTGSGSTLFQYTTSADYVDCAPESQQNENSSPAPGLFLREDGGVVQINCILSDFAEHALTPIPSMQSKRGLLKRTVERRQNGTMVREKNYSYAFPSIGEDVIPVIAGEVVKNIHYPRFNIEPDTTTTTELLTGGSVTKTESCHYNSMGLMTERTVNTSDGATIVNRYLYACDTVLPFPVHTAMLNSHNISKLLFTEKRIVDGGNSQRLSASRFSYSQPSAVEHPELVSLASREDWVGGNRWQMVQSYINDHIGNIVETTGADGVSTATLWSYKGQKLVAVANNATLNEVNSALVASGLVSSDSLSGLSKLSDTSWSQLKGIREAMPSSLVDTYRYDDSHFEITDAVSPDGTNESFNYDGYGRLARKANSRGKTTEMYAYGLATAQPLAAAIMCGDNFYIEDTIMANVSATGGAGIYTYSWTLKDSLGQVIDQDILSLTQGPSFMLPIMSSHMVSGERYFLECTVSDRVSNESVTQNISFFVNPAKIFFRNIQEFPDLNNNHYTMTAQIFTDVAATLYLLVDNNSSQHCTLSCGTQTLYEGYGKDTDVIRSAVLQPGITNFTLEVTNSALANVEVQIAQGTTGEIGIPNAISINY